MTSDLIRQARAWLVDLPVENARTDAIQAFLKQETIFVELTTDSGLTGTGYSYTIGTGGASVLALLRTVLLDAIIGTDIHRPEQVWRAAFNSSRATTTGAITSLALAAIDTAVWDARSHSTGLPLWKLAGGYTNSIPVYDTEGGWLHLTETELVAQAAQAKERGMAGVKLKIGKPRAQEDLQRLAAVRAAVGPELDIMVDANQSLTAAEATRRARLLEQVDIYWLEEPLPADDISGHQRLASATSIPIAVGESLYSVAQFAEYLRRQATSIVQVDVARVGGITPWLRVAHLAAAFNVAVAPHFLMEIHLPLVCAIPNGLYLEHIPQLRAITQTEITIADGRANAPETLGLGMLWNRDAIDDLTVA